MCMQIFARISVLIFVLAQIQDGQSVLGEEDKDNLSCNTLASLIGKYHTDVDFRDVRKKLGSPLMASYFETMSCFYHSWPNRGVSMCFDAKNNLSGVFLHAKGFESHEQWTGHLPLELSFEDSEEQVKRKAGEPDNIVVLKGKFREYEYDKLGLTVLFDVSVQKPKVLQVKLIRPYISK